MSTSLNTTLEKIRRQTEEEQTKKLADELKLPYAILDDYPFGLDALSLLPFEVVRERLYAIYVKTEHEIKVAVVHPEDKLILDEVNQLGSRFNAEVELAVVSPSSFKVLLNTYARLQKEAQEAARMRQVAAAQAEDKDYVKKIRSLDDLRNELSHISVTDLLDAIIAAAYNQEASDIHLEPGDSDLTVRFRIDGVLQKVLSLPLTFHRQLVSRIRIMSEIKIDNPNIDQDGRFSMKEKGIAADFRVSIVPTGYGPGVVMRILRQDMRATSLEELGFSPHNLEILQAKIRRPYGLIVVTGPTGSGKSTTLYSILNKLNSPEKKILTLEDPIEYRLPGIQQSQVNPDKGFTFAEGLRGLLRQDPDVVMVGEIRDPETATIALNASLTGHLVLSTLHTNDAVTAHTRFLELGVEPFLLTGSVQLIVAQRLVRKLVPGSSVDNPTYKGRIVISEVLAPTPEFEQAVIQHADQTTLVQVAKKGGMVPMVEDGLEKVRAGLTTESEVYRVTAA